MKEKQRLEISDFPLGSTLHGDGTVFRVWAPHADAVCVLGDWNAWKSGSDSLNRAENGVWEGFVEGAGERQEYRYEIRNGEAVFSRIDPRAREVTHSDGNGIIRVDRFDWEGDAFEMPPHNRLVVYELHAKTFAEGIVGADVPALEGVARALDHLSKLGVNAIEIMPVAEFAGELSWGYNPAHIFAVESAYGGPDALKALVKEAHRRGIAVILDVVYNHFGPSDLHLWQFDGWRENDLGGIYFYNDWRSETPWGNTRPDYGRGEVRQFIHDNALMWLEEFHLDGLRYDMTLYMRHVRGDDDPGAELPEGWSLAQWVNGEVRERFPEKILIAEDLRNNNALTNRIEWGGAGFHAQWDARFVHPVRDVLIKREDAWRSMHEVAEALLAKYNHDAYERIIYTESHDEVANGKARVPHEIDSSDEQGRFAQMRSCLGAGLIMTAPGIPMIFQGQEFLEGGWFRDDVPLDWDLRKEFSGIVRLYRDLIALRLDKKGLTKGLTGQGLRVSHLNEAHNVLAFHRWCDHGPCDDTLVVCNFSNARRENYRIGFPGEGLWSLRLNTVAPLYSPAFEEAPCGDVEATGASLDGFPASSELTLPAYGLLIFSQDLSKA